jgi:superfamily I DNA/RNA helicase
LAKPAAVSVSSYAAQRTSGSRRGGGRCIDPSGPETSFLTLNDMTARGKQPTDYVLLVHQKPDEFENGLKTAMASEGLCLRNENKALAHTLQAPKGSTTLQDLLTDEIVGIALALLRLGLDMPAPQQWLKVSQTIERLRAAEHDDDVACNYVAEELNAFLLKLRPFMKSHAPDQKFANKLVDEVFKFLDPCKIRLTYLRYATGELLGINMAAFREHLIACANESHDWPQCLDLYEGIGQIPIMTVHKSKGLEFDTVIFVGLEDDAWWAHKPGDPEGIATFFVALSRAKQRAIFTFCHSRGRSTKVADLHVLLAKAGVTQIRIP